MNSDENQDRALAEWSARLARELGLGELSVDINAVLALAGEAAHAVVRPAAPLTTFLVGYAAGRAAAAGVATPQVAFERAAETTSALARAQAERTTESTDAGKH
jgi:hypothetical protein